MSKIYVLTDVPKEQVAQIRILVEAAGGSVEVIPQSDGRFTVQSTYGTEAVNAPTPGGGSANFAFAGQDAGASEPAWMAIARGEIGQKEVPGTGPGKNNPRIVEYFAYTTMGKAEGDHIPWCGAFVSFCLANGGYPTFKGSARAEDWLGWGKRLQAPRPGCIVVLKPLAEGSSGHVGFFVKSDGDHIHLLAGNQSDAVNITPYPKSYVRENGFRWPV